MGRNGWASHSEIQSAISDVTCPFVDLCVPLSAVFKPSRSATCIWLAVAHLESNIVCFMRTYPPSHCIKQIQDLLLGIWRLVALMESNIVCHTNLSVVSCNSHESKICLSEICLCRNFCTESCTHVVRMTIKRARQEYT